MAGYSIFAHFGLSPSEGRFDKPLEYYILLFIAVYRFMVNLSGRKRFFLIHERDTKVFSLALKCCL